MENTKCLTYLRSKNSDIKDEDLNTTLSQLLEADPSPDGFNCEWIIDEFINKKFLLEDVSRVREDILKFKELFGQRRPLPKKGYSELKIMIREKMEKEDKKSVAKTEKTITKTSGNLFSDCKSYFKNIKKTLPEEYKNLPPERLEILFQRIQEANPTDDFKDCIWIVEEFKKGNIQEEDLDEVKKYLGKYLKKGLPLPNFYPNFPIISNYQLVKDTVDNNVDLLFTGEDGILLIPQTEETSCYYGSQTSWCTAQRNKNNLFSKYAKKGNIYIWFDKKLKDKFQFHFEELQFMDRDDEPISKNLFKQFRNHPVLNIIFDEGLEKIKKLEVKKIVDFIEDFYPDFEFRPEFEKILIKNKDPNMLNRYAKKVIKVRWPEAEDIIVQDQKLAYEYARDIIKGRWPEAEDIIMKDISNKYKNLEDYPITADNIDLPYWYLYVRDMIKGRWPEVEDIIIKNKNMFLINIYVRDLIKDRWPEAEEFFLRQDKNDINLIERMIEYAKYGIKGRWPEAEKFIINNKNIGTITDYAEYVIKGRWPEAEQILLEDAERGDLIWDKENEEYKDPFSPLLWYARDIIKGRWPEAEQILLESLENGYEDVDIEEFDPVKYLVLYAEKVIKGRWPEAEELILNSDSKYAAEYKKLFKIKSK